MNSSKRTGTPIPGPVRRASGWSGMVLVAAAGLSGCVSLDTIAPPAEGLSGAGDVRVAEGRRLYLTDCTKCHAAEPVRRYTVQEWASILPEMAEESHFTPAQTAAVEAYIRAVLSTPIATPR